MTENDAYKPVVEYAVRRFADRCIQHPRLEEDPICVIATEREKFLTELAEEAILPEKKEKPAAISNGINRKSGRNGHVARTR